VKHDLTASYFKTKKMWIGDLGRSLDFSRNNCKIWRALGAVAFCTRISPVPSVPS
jgi:hypothetical protein